MAGKNFDKNEKEWLLNEILYHGKTAKCLSEYYHIPLSTIKTWKGRHSKGLSQHDSAGRPEKLTKNQKNELDSLLTNSKYNVDLATWATTVNEMAAETAKSQGLSVSKYGNISRRSFKRLDEDLDVRNVNAEVTTKPREEGCRSLRNLHSNIAMNGHVNDLIDGKPYLIIVEEYCVCGKFFDR